MPPPLAQTLNYDVLFIIFVISCPEWDTAALTLSSVCRLWRSTALSVPEIWSKIYVDPSITPYSLHISLERSKPLPLHIVIHDASSDEQLLVISSAANRIGCMTIMNSCRLLQNQFPILERLVLVLNEEADRQEEYFSKSSQFSQLREFCFISTAAFSHLLDVRGGFPGLQKLEITCDDDSNWYNIVQSASNTLVSLILYLQPTSPVYNFFFPQLRHLLVTACDRAQVVLDLDAPRLESVEESQGVGGEYGVEIRLRDPKSVKQLCVVHGPLDLTLYPALRKLWIDLYNPKILDSLGHQITFCPELEAIFYCGQSEPGEANYGEDECPRPESALSVLMDVVRETEKDIAVREFCPTELELPGSMRRNNECSGSLCDQISEHILSEFY